MTQAVKNPPAMQEMQEMAATPVFLPGQFHGQRSLVGYSPWGCKESDMTEHAHMISYKENPKESIKKLLKLYKFSTL